MILMIKTIEEKVSPIIVLVDSKFEYDKKINIISLFEFISSNLVYIDHLVLYDGKTDVVIYYSEIDEIIDYGSYVFDIDRKKLNSIIKSKNSRFNTRMQYYNFEINFEEFDESIDLVFKYDKESRTITIKGTCHNGFYDEIKEFFNK